MQTLARMGQDLLTRETGQSGPHLLQSPLGYQRQCEQRAIQQLLSDVKKAVALSGPDIALEPLAMLVQHLIENR